MPLQKITVEISTEPIPEDERPDFAYEIARAVQVVLLDRLASRDALVAEVVRWEER